MNLGYEGEQSTITVAFEEPANRACTAIEQQFKRAHNTVRAIGERGNSLLKTTSKLCATSAFVPGLSASSRRRTRDLHIEPGRTT